MHNPGDCFAVTQHIVVTEQEQQVREGGRGEGEKDALSQHPRPAAKAQPRGLHLRWVPRQWSLRGIKLIYCKPYAAKWKINSRPHAAHTWGETLLVECRLPFGVVILQCLLLKWPSSWYTLPVWQCCFLPVYYYITTIGISQSNPCFDGDDSIWCRYQWKLMFYHMPKLFYDVIFHIEKRGKGSKGYIFLFKYYIIILYYINIYIYIILYLSL